jgi:hypothetical protein
MLMVLGPMVLLLVLLVPGAADAACSGSSPNRVAANASRTEVAACVTAAVSGDTITVPAGTASWSSPIALPSNKDLTLIGATNVSCSGTPITCTANNQTTLTCGNGTCFTFNLGAAHRVSGFTMTGAGDGGVAFTGDQNINKHFRIDHNRIASGSGWARMWVAGGSNAVHPQGIIDNNILVDISINAIGTSHQWDDPCSTCQHQLWAQDTPLGDSRAIIYVENNHFQNTSGNINSSDGSYGGRLVARFNNVTGGRSTFEVHGMQGENRGNQRMEFYGNSMSGLTGFSGLTMFRGGTGVIFNNTQSAAFSFGVLLTNDRSEYDEGGPGIFGSVAECTGTAPAGVDQNTSGRSGWRCRDQVGVARDATLWRHSPSFGAWNQVAAPLYIWGNRTGASAMSVDVDNIGAVDTHIVANRDFYNQATPFTGETGVGVGPVASRPSTCTAGVAYWATDEGEWNSRQAGPDGRLYKCTATNTWTLHYMPYPYPHPWTLDTAGTTTPGTPGSMQLN